MRVELELFKAQILSHANSVEEAKAAFINSEEFKDVVAAKVFPYFQIGFENCKGQFAEDGLLPPDREDFPSFDKAVNSLSADEEIPTTPLLNVSFIFIHSM